MKKIIQQLFQFFSQDVDWLYLILVVLFLGILFCWNYYWGGETILYTKYRRQAGMFFVQLLLYVLVFVGCYLLKSVLSGNFEVFKQPLFLSIIIGAPLVFAFQQYFYGHRIYIEENYTANDIPHYSIMAEYIVRSVLLFSPVFILWMIQQPTHKMGWQLSGGGINYNAYFLLLAIMIPLVWMAAQQASFQSVYPKLHHALNAGGNKWKNIAFFETSYSINFIAVEAFFRGLLVIGLIQMVGKDAIIPMAAFYCTIHFGKPPAECFSSFFGGLILGVVAYYSQSIIGGIIVHLGIAWLMELFGFWYKN